DGSFPDAEADYARALHLLEPLTAQFPAEAAYRKDMAHTYLNLAAVATARLLTEGPAAGPKERQQLFDRAIRASDEAVRRWAALSEAAPGEPDFRKELATAHLNRGRLRHLVGRAGPAEDDYRSAVALLAPLASQFRGVPDYRHLLSNAYLNLGELLRTLN